METINVTCRCPLCQSVTTITADFIGYIAWTRGVVIQRALPSLSLCERETLLSGFCSDCQEQFFEEDE